MLTIKLITVDGEFKALVLDESKTEGRLQALFEGASLEGVALEAEAYIEGQKALQAVVWH